MAFSTEAGILAMLKTFYAKEGLVNLLYRNDPLLKKIKKERVEGKQQNFSALYSRGGAVSANFLTAKRLATESAKAKEFQVVPGQIFSGCVFNAKELAASKTQKGAYINVASAKFFANAESFRKTLAVALYGTGHGELYTTGAAVSVVSGDFTETFPRSAIMGIDVGSELEYKATANATTVLATVVVKKIDGTTVTLTGTAAVTVPLGSVCCLSGCTGGSGEPLLPIGLAGWIPETVAANDNFFGVNRSEARDRLAGSLVDDSSDNTATHYGTIQKGILALRRMGSLADMIVINDEDYLTLQKEVESKTYFQKVGGTGKTVGKTGLGYEGFGISVSTNWLDNVIDSPYCPKGTAYILDSGAVELWTYTNADKIADGIVDNEAGKPDVQADGEVANRPYQLLVDDLFSVTPGTDTADGAAALVTLNFFGSFAVTNPSVCGVLKFYNA